MSLAKPCLYLLLAAASGACNNTQRWPSPMGGEHFPSASTAEMVAGPSEVQVLRHADPVEVRPAGGVGSYPLRFYGKKERLKSGGMLFVRAGGKAEVLWPGKNASVTFLGEGVCRIGESARGESTLRILEVENARLVLTPEMHIELPGGAQLSGDPAEESSGPYLLERIAVEVLRVRNQSRSICKLEYREEAIELAPGQLVDLALLASGSTPELLEAGVQELTLAGLILTITGEARATQQDRTVRVSADGPAHVRAQGVAIDLELGDEIALRSLDGGRGLPAAGTSAPAPPPLEPATVEAPAESQSESAPSQPQEPR